MSTPRKRNRRMDVRNTEVGASHVVPMVILQGPSLHQATPEQEIELRRGIEEVAVRVLGYKACRYLRVVNGLDLMGEPSDDPDAVRLGRGLRYLRVVVGDMTRVSMAAGADSTQPDIAATESGKIIPRLPGLRQRGQAVGMEFRPICIDPEPTPATEEGVPWGPEALAPANTYDRIQLERPPDLVFRRVDDLPTAPDHIEPSAYTNRSF